jgi:sugar lactone lactonase YvrE
MILTLIPFLTLILAVGGCLSSSSIEELPDPPKSFEPQGVTSISKLPEPFFLEGGPFSITEDETIYFVDPHDKSIVRKAKLGNPTKVTTFINLNEWLKTENSKTFQIDDIFCDYLGRLIIAESTTGKILRISKDGRKLENLADSYDGYRFSKIKGLAGNERDQIFIGTPNAATIYEFDPRVGSLNILNDDLVRPNDFAMNRKGDRLLVAESVPSRIIVFDLNQGSSIDVSWDLIHLPSPYDEPISLDILKDRPNVLAVLLRDNQTLLFFNLVKGRIIKRVDLPAVCTHVRTHQDWIYLQAEKGIIRIPNPFL